MLVKVKPGMTAFREKHYRDEDDGVFRLFDSPPNRPNEPFYKDHETRAEKGEYNPTRMEKWLGLALEPATPEEAAEYEATESPTAFLDTAAARGNPEIVMNRAGTITQTVHQLDHKDDTHWLPDGRPDPQAVEILSGLTRVQSSEIDAVCIPPVVREIKPRAPRKNIHPDA